jgi:hypothetical protein
VRHGVVRVAILAACTLAACRGILGIDPLPSLEADAGSAADGPDATPGVPEDGTDGGCDPNALQTDPDNCGACGHRCCGLLCVDGGCATGAPRTIGASLTRPSAIALDPDGTTVYWSQITADAGSAILRFAKGTAQATTVVEGLGYMNAMQVGDSAIFVTTSDGTVTRVEPKSGSLATATAIVTGNVGPGGLALAGGQVWWTEGGEGPGQGAIHVANLNGTGEQTPYGSRTSPTGIAISGSTVAWTEFDVGHNVVVGTTDGGAPTTYQEGQEVPGPILWNDAGVWWGDFNGTGLHSLTLDGGQSVIANASGGITAIAADTANVYWTVLPQGGAGTIWTTAIAGSTPPTQLAENLPCPVGVVADGQCLYWINAGSCSSDYDSYKAEAGTGSVMSMERPP